MSVDRWLAVLGLTVAVLGIPFTVIVSRYYYRRSDKKRVPTFVIQSRKALSQATLTSSAAKLTVLYDGKEVGREGITEAKIYFWNSGTMPIRTEDVLRPYTISSSVPILSYSIVKFSREITGLSIQRVTENEIKLVFSALEGGDGCTLTIVYDGPTSTGIEFNGAVLDSRKPLVLPPHDSYAVPKSKRLLEASAWFLVVPAGLLLSLAGIAIIAGIGKVLEYLLSKVLGQTTSESVLSFIGWIFIAALFLIAIGANAWSRIRRVNDPYLPPDVKG